MVEVTYQEDKPKWINWTPELDAMIVGLRMAGNEWQKIAERMGLSRNTVLERGRRLNIPRINRYPTRTVMLEPRDRLPRSPGHPDTWDVITAGTVLEGSEYPIPLFA
jgi:hypothetical protein